MATSLIRPSGGVYRRGAEQVQVRSAQGCREIIDLRIHATIPNLLCFLQVFHLWRNYFLRQNDLPEWCDLDLSQGWRK